MDYQRSVYSAPKYLAALALQTDLLRLCAERNHPSVWYPTLGMWHQADVFVVGPPGHFGWEGWHTISRRC